jgi:hypothetical protein
MSGRARVSEVEVPAGALALTTLPRVDYRDGFRLELLGGPVLSGEEWAREMLEGAAPETRRSLRRGWPLLGLKMAPPGAAGSILGWRLRHSDDEYALLGVDSRIGMPAELLFRPEPGGLFFATLIQQRNPFVRALWTPIGPPHRRVVPALMRGAADRLAPGRSRPPRCRRRGRRPSRRRRASPRCRGSRGRGRRRPRGRR